MAKLFAEDWDDPNFTSYFGDPAPWMVTLMKEWCKKGAQALANDIDKKVLEACKSGVKNVY